MPKQFKNNQTNQLNQDIQMEITQLEMPQSEMPQMDTSQIGMPQSNMPQSSVSQILHQYHQSEHADAQDNTTELTDNIDELNSMLNHTCIQPQYNLSQSGVQRLSGILDDKLVNKQPHYLVQWTDGSTSWEHVENISKTPLQHYWLQKEADNYNKVMVSNGCHGQRAFLYLRTSTAHRSPTQVSLDVQKKDLMSYCSSQKFIIGGIYFDEGTSAKNMENLESLNLLLNQLASGDIIIFWDVSRFSRNNRQALNLMEDLSSKNIKIYFFKEKLGYEMPQERHQVRIALSDAQFLSESISDRIKRINEYKRANGSYVGTPRFGYKVQKSKAGKRVLTKCHKEQRIIALVKKLAQTFKQGNQANQANHPSKYHKISKDGLRITERRSIVDVLNNQNIRFRGRRFTQRNVSLLLNRQ